MRPIDPVFIEAAKMKPRDPTDCRNTREYWTPIRLRKYSDKGVVRAVPPKETIRRATRVLKEAGITRVADVTGLDRLGIPNYMTVRPRDLEPGISYYNGKGTTVADAHAGAIMEAIERQAGEACTYNIFVNSFSELWQQHHCVKPDEIIVPRLGPYHDDTQIEWVAGFDLLNGLETFAPLNCVVCPHEAKLGPTIFMASTNGLASGNSRTEALCHALCEVIERDAHAITMARTQIGPAARRLIGQADEIRSMPRQITLTQLPYRAAFLVSKMRKAGLEVYLRDLSSTAGIATIYCTIVDPSWQRSPNAHGGCGAHPDARVALLRALTEAAQSRVTCIQGGREDLPQIMHQKSRCKVEDVASLFGGGELIHFSDIPSYEHQYIDEDVEFLLSHLPGSGIEQVVAFDMTDPLVGIPVVRVVVPRAESWAVFHLHTGRGVFGPRVAKEL